MSRGNLGVGLCVSVLASSTAVWACPQCGLQESPQGSLLYYFLGAAVLFPYAIASVAVHFIRKLSADSAPSPSKASPQEGSAP
jgi:hypothetical protein